MAVQKVVKSEEKPIAVVEANIKSKESQAMYEKAILDSADSEKQHKDFLLKNVVELQAHIVTLNDRIGELSKEHESKRRVLDGLGGSIAGAQSEIHNLRATFEKNNADLMREIAKKQVDVEAADKTFQILVKENVETKRLNDVETNRLAQHRQICDSQVLDMKNALEQNSTEWKKREADILAREEVLKADRQAFEQEKLDLVPEIARITSITNENKMLLQKVEIDRLDIENLRRANSADRERLDQERLIASSKNKAELERLANEEARLRKWEQEIKDYDLEVRAKASQADKILRREQLQKEVDSNKK